MGGYPTEFEFRNFLMTCEGEFGLSQMSLGFRGDHEYTSRTAPLAINVTVHNGTRRTDAVDYNLEHAWGVRREPTGPEPEEGE